MKKKLKGNVILFIALMMMALPILVLKGNTQTQENPKFYELTGRFTGLEFFLTEVGTLIDFNENLEVEKVNLSKMKAIHQDMLNYAKKYPAAKEDARLSGFFLEVFSKHPNQKFEIAQRNKGNHISLIVKVNGRTYSYNKIRNQGVEKRTFNDIKGLESEEYVKFLNQTGIIGGTSPTTFNPNGKVTKGQYAAMLVRMNYNMVLLNLEDKSKGHWASREIKVLRELGVINELKYNPNELITRDEAFTMLGRYLSLYMDSYEAKGVDFFKDFTREPNYHYLDILVYYDIINQDRNNKFNGKSFLTRSQLSKIFYNAMQLEVEKKSTWSYF